MTEEEVFLDALDLPDATARAGYLNRTCGGDAEFRRRVETLLDAHFRSGEFLDVPAAVQVEGGWIDHDTVAIPGDAVSAENDPEESDWQRFLTPAKRPDSLGRLGHYEVLQVLGRGGFGIVFRAFDDVLQRPVAIKVLAPPIAATSPARRRFLREARASAKVRHVNIVQVYAVEEQPLPYLVMEFIPGETLQQRLDRTGPLETAEVLQIGRQIALGLAAAHGAGLIHRDIKPGNILIEAGPHPHVKITDFGLARAADDASMTQSGTVAGTPMFMAPEQANGAKVDHRADLFSFGSVLYTMCSGRPPFRANTMLAVLKRVAEDTPRPIPEIIPEVPQWLCDLIMRLHVKNPADRFSSAQEVADLLAQHLAEIERPGSVLPPPVARPSGAETAVVSRGLPETVPAVRRPNLPTRRWAAAAAVLVILFGGLGFTEATGVTDFHGTVIRLFSPEGTRVVDVDDPAGSGKSVTKAEEPPLASVTKAGERPADASAWERSLAAMPEAERLKAVVTRLKELNPGFDGRVEPRVENGLTLGLKFTTDHVSNISPIRALTDLKWLGCSGSYSKSGGMLADLTPLKGLPITWLDIGRNKVSDLTPLKGMSLELLDLREWPGTDLAPLKGMPLKDLNIQGGTSTDISPLKDLPLARLWLDFKAERDAPILRAIPTLETINDKPAAQFWKEVDARSKD